MRRRPKWTSGSLMAPQVIEIAKNGLAKAASSPLGREPQSLERQWRRQPLHDHREGDDREGGNENIVATGKIGGQRERQSQCQSAAQAAPPHQVLLIERDRPARA